MIISDCLDTTTLQSLEQFHRTYRNQALHTKVQVEQGFDALLTELAILQNSKLCAALAHLKHEALGLLMPPEPAGQPTDTVCVVSDNELQTVEEELLAHLSTLNQLRDYLSPETYLRVLNALAARQKCAYRAGADIYSVLQHILLASRRQRLPAMERGISSDALSVMDAEFPAAMEAAWTEWDAAVSRSRCTGHSKPCSTEKTVANPSLSPDLLEARAFTLGKTLLLVGGECRREQQQTLETALSCTIVWVPSRKTAPPDRIVTAGKKCDLLCSLINLIGHHEEDAVTRLHRQTGLPMVRVFGGVSPTSVARAIREQLQRD